MWKIATHTEAVEMDGEWVILDGERYVVTKLNEAGGFLWNRLKEGATLGMLVGAMTEEYDITEAQAKTDILVFIDHLISCSLVEQIA